MCDLSGPASTTGGCQRRTRNAGAVCAPQVHGCMPEAVCNGVAGTCPPQISLPGIIYEDPAKHVRLLLPDGSTADSEMAVVPSIDTVAISYDDFRVQCGELQLRMGVIPDGDCDVARVSQDVGRAFGQDFVAPPRGSFVAIHQPVATPIRLVYASAGADTLTPEDTVMLARNAVAGTVTLSPGADLAQAVAPGTATVSSAFVDVELRCEHAVSLRAVVFVDSWGAQSYFAAPAAAVVHGWHTVSARADANRTDAGFDWTNVAGVAFAHSGGADAAIDGVLALSVRSVLLRTRAQAAPCFSIPILPVVGNGTVRAALYAAYPRAAETAAYRAAFADAPVDVTPLYDFEQTKFLPGAVLSLEVQLPSTATVAEVSLECHDGHRLAAGVIDTQPAAGHGWTLVQVVVRSGHLTASASAQSFQRVQAVVVVLRGVNSSNVSAVDVGRVRLILGTHCAHMFERVATSSAELFVESSLDSTGGGGLVLTAAPRSAVLNMPGSSVEHVSGAWLNLDLSTWFDEDCSCFPSAAMEVVVSTQSGLALTSVALLEAASGHGLIVNFTAPNVEASRVTLRASLLSESAVVVGPPAAWQNLNTLHVERVLPSSGDGRGQLTIHSLRVVRVDVPCVDSTTLSQEKRPSGAVAIGSVPVSLGVEDVESGHLREVTGLAALDEAENVWQGSWTDNAPGYNMSYLSAASLRGPRPLVVSIGSSLGPTGNVIAGLGVFKAENGSQGVATARDAVSGDALWHATLPGGFTPLHVIESMSDDYTGSTSSVPDVLRRRLGASTAVDDRHGSAARRLAASVDSECPVGWTAAADSANRCFAPLYGLNTFIGARDTCQALGGDLATPKSAVEHDQLVALMAPPGKPYAATTFYIGLVLVNGVHMWVDGEIESTVPVVWDAGEPLSSDRCAVVVAGSVRAAPCDTVAASACEFHTQSHDSCSPGWELRGDRCYRLDNTGRHWHAGVDVCEALGGIGASIHSVEQHRQAQSVGWRGVDSWRESWLGGHDLYGEGYFRWLDQTPFDYALWGLGELNGGTYENCLFMRAEERGGFGDFYCLLEPIASMCYYPEACRTAPKHMRCQNGGQCVALQTLRMGVSCVCPLGFAGILCQRKCTPGLDTDGDGVDDCEDHCPFDPDVFITTDLDYDGVYDCPLHGCPANSGPPVDLDGDGQLECSPCPDGGTLVMDDPTKCFVPMSSYYYPWDAVRDCRIKYGLSATLPIVASHYQNKLLVQMLSINGYGAAYLGVYVHSHKVAWFDGSVADDNTFANWDAINPTPGYFQVGHDSIWRTNSAPSGAICEVKLVDNDPCPNGWRVLGTQEKCIYVSTDIKPWSTAKESCLAMGSDLLSIHSVQEQNYLEALTNGHSMWIGLSYGDVDAYTWTDGTPLDFEAWGPGQPNDPSTLSVRVLG